MSDQYDPDEIRYGFHDTDWSDREMQCENDEFERMLTELSDEWWDGQQEAADDDELAMMEVDTDTL